MATLGALDDLSWLWAVPVIVFVPVAVSLIGMARR